MIAISCCMAYNLYLDLIDTKFSVDFKNFTSAKLSIANILREQISLRDIVISVASTYGVYIFSSILHGEPWHIFTCSIQYFLFLPFYINILTIYAFCNIHDISWGTKGDNDKSANNIAFETNIQETTEGVRVFVAEEEVDNEYDGFLKDLKKIAINPEQKQQRDITTKKEDYYKLFRTNLVLLWMFSNSTLVFFFTSNLWKNYIESHFLYPPNRYNPYLIFGNYSFFVN